MEQIPGGIPGGNPGFFLWEILAKFSGGNPMENSRNEIPGGTSGENFGGNLKINSWVKSPEEFLEQISRRIPYEVL